MGIFTNRKGEKYTTNEGYQITIIEYRGAFDCDIYFENGLILQNIHCSSVLRGDIKNPYHCSVFGVGYFGVGDYKSKIDKKQTKVYGVWSQMLQRCYSEKQQIKQPTYVGCFIDKRWHNFQVFAKWFEENYKEGFALDKDILFKGNKIYSPETCCFVPQELNNLIIKNDKRRGKYPLGVSKNGSGFAARANINGEGINLGYFKTPEKAFEAYKKAKEKEIKDTAKLCKNILPKKVYQALINYKIEIKD